MYAITWDESTGGVLLSETPENGPSRPVRPVFFDELDLLGFDRHWTYPKCQEPLLWASERRYFYRGSLCAEVRGGGFFENPELTLHQPELSLEPVDVKAMLDKNAALMDGLVTRAIEFVHHEHERFRRRVDATVVAFSGGKDSIVVLDLVQRALPPDQFVVVFSDTSMELSATYEAVDRARAHWPNLTFHTARSHLTAPQSWELFGPPSRLHRWCCTVHKTAPSLLLLREITGKPSVSAFLYDGVRWEESERRSSYSPVSIGKKHATQVNASPILTWNSAEVYLYLMNRDLLLNQAYRYGLPRVGCAVCPFNSRSGEAITFAAYRNEIQPYLTALEAYSVKQGVASGQTTEYLRNGHWKVRAGGSGVGPSRNKVLEGQETDPTRFLIQQPNSDWTEWAKALGPLAMQGQGRGTLGANGRQYRFFLTKHHNAMEIDVYGLNSRDQVERSRVRATVLKAAYCVGCRSCEVECPAGALSVSNGVHINETKCKHCMHCLAYTEKGCVAAKSLWISGETTSMNKIGSYQTFGLTTPWLREYFSNPESWWHSNSLGNRQFESMRIWLAEAEVCDRTGRITPFGSIVRDIGADEDTTWLLLWTNWGRNSGLIRWYARSVPWNVSLGRKELAEGIPVGSPRSKENAVAALLYLLRHSPLGERLRFGLTDPDPPRSSRIVKSGPTEVHPLVVLYSLFRLAEATDRYAITLEELANSQEGPIALFNLSQERLARSLQGLASTTRLIKVEFVRDLDAIYLERSATPIEVLSRL